jgi:hypothetical protein
MFVTQETAVDLHSLGSALTPATMVGVKHTDAVTEMNLYHCMTFVLLVVWYFVVTSLKLNLCTALSTLNTAESDCINSHAQNTTAL